MKLFRLLVRNILISVCFFSLLLFVLTVCVLISHSVAILIFGKTTAGLFATIFLFGVLGTACASTAHELSWNGWRLK